MTDASAMIAQMKQLMEEAKEREDAWPPVFIESSMCPLGTFVGMHYSMFEDKRWRVLFHPSDRATVKQVLAALPQAKMRKLSTKKDAMKRTQVKLHFEGSFHV